MHDLFQFDQSHVARSELVRTMGVVSDVLPSSIPSKHKTPKSWSKPLCLLELGGSLIPRITINYDKNQANITTEGIEN